MTRRPSGARRAVPIAVAAVVAAWLAASVPTRMLDGVLPRARADGPDTSATSVAAANGVVVHGVETKQLASRLREVDERLVTGDDGVAAVALADLASADLAALVEESAGVWLSASEGVLQRVATLPADALATYRSKVDAQAEIALTRAVSSGDTAPLARDAARLVFSTQGPKLLLLLADLRMARGELGGAAHALEDIVRLLPAHAPQAVAAAASRLAAIHAANGDVSAITWLRRDLPDSVLALHSPATLARPESGGTPDGTVAADGTLAADGMLTADATLAAELDRASTQAARRAAAMAPGPTGPLRLVAETALTSPRRETGVGAGGREPGTLRERPLPIGTKDRPALLIRLQNPNPQQPGAPAQVVAIEPLTMAPMDPPVPGAKPRVPPFRPLWGWPSSATEEPRPAREYPFAPALLTDDLVLFTWPAPPSDDPSRVDSFVDGSEERHELVLLSISAQGKLVDERGRTEADRSDADPELESLSFCGRPCVDGRSVYVTAVRRADNGELTELHVCRFDFLPEGRGGRLVLRWRRHVLDGLPMHPALFSVRGVEDHALAVALPTPPIVRAGRVYVGSNTGAVVCLDAASGHPDWIETYRRFGPSARLTVRESELTTWDDVPLFSDGPYVFAAPRDAETLLQFRRAPRGARSTTVDSFEFSGPNGTARAPGRILQDVVPTEVVGIRDGVVYLAGRVARRPFASVSVEGSPLAAFRLADRSAPLAQIQEFASAGTPCLVRGALLFPSPKAIYRVPLDAFAEPPQVLWRFASGGDPSRGQDRIGHLIPDGDRLWTVTSSRVLLFETEK
ncbi:MAG: hypothetical protein K8T90_01240 [Planctomycetes bacterium]|nr:hypothetical protein [Planctomycetota bacterium]